MANPTDWRRRKRAEEAALKLQKKRTREVYDGLLDKKRKVAFPHTWADHFWNFLEDVGLRPGLARLKRRTRSLPHSKSNSYWAEPDTKVPEKLIYRGQEISFGEAMRISGLSRYTLRNRLLRSKWSAEQAIETPPSNGNWKRGFTRDDESASEQATAGPA